MDEKVTAIHQEIGRLEGINPLIADNPKDTMSRVASALTYLSVLQYGGNESPLAEDVREKWRDGRSLIYQTMINALIVQSRKRNPRS